MVPAVLLHGAGTLGALALLEAVLSADNAVAIAALVRDLEPAPLRTKALNWGLVAAFLLRALLICLAIWVVRFPQVQVLGGLYLIWLAARHFQAQLNGEADDEALDPDRPRLPFASVIGLVALTDLAFSLDSVTAAVAVTDELWLVIAGGAMGVAMLRLLAGLVMGWMERFVNLQNAAYLTVLAVGLRLTARVLAPALAPSEPAVLVMMLVFFAWGFSRRSSSAGDGDGPAVPIEGASIETLAPMAGLGPAVAAIQVSSSSGSGV